MKILVVGATGGTGGETLRQGLILGHQMVALARRPDAIDPTLGTIDIVSGNVLDRSSLRRAVAGADAVISALGIGGLKASRHAGTLLSEGTKNIVDAMREEKVRRLVVVSSVGVEEDPTEGFVYRSILKPLFLKKLYEDMAVMERVVRDSGLDWTLVRPPRLLDGPPRGQFLIKVGGNVPYARTIRRADLAAFLLRSASADTYSTSVVSISHEGKDQEP